MSQRSPLLCQPFQFSQWFTGPNSWQNKNLISSSQFQCFDDPTTPLTPPGLPGVKLPDFLVLTYKSSDSRQKTIWPFFSQTIKWSVFERGYWRSVFEGEQRTSTDCATVMTPKHGCEDDRGAQTSAPAPLPDTVGSKMKSSTPSTPWTPVRSVDNGVDDKTKKTTNVNLWRQFHGSLYHLVPCIIWTRRWKTHWRQEWIPNSRLMMTMVKTPWSGGW